MEKEKENEQQDISMHKQKSMCKIRCSKHQKQLNFAIYDLFTLTYRFKVKFFTLQFTVIIHYTSLTKSHICIDRALLSVFFFLNKASLVLVILKCKCLCHIRI